MENKNFSKFDVVPGCEERADFVPTHNDLIDSLPPEELEASYRRDMGRELFDLFSDPDFQYGFNELYPLMRDNGEI